MEANQSSVAEGADGAISAWAADGRNRISVQELTPENKEENADLVEADRLRELEAWVKFDVFSSYEAFEVRKQIAQSQWVLTWKMADGKKCVKARLVAKGFKTRI